MNYAENREIGGNPKPTIALTLTYSKMKITLKMAEKIKNGGDMEWQKSHFWKKY